jgi:hypothetical protein
MGWQLYRQYFHPDIEDELAEIRHKDGLGFADIATHAEPPKPLIQFFEKTLPANSALFQAKFEQQRPLLTHYAIDKKLETKEIGPMIRSGLYAEFVRRVPRPAHWDEGYGELDRWDDI